MIYKIGKELTRFRRRMSGRKKLAEVQIRMQSVHGSALNNLATTDLIVVCPMRNGGEQVSSFCEYYLNLGARHIVFLDDDSQDDSIDQAAKYKDTSVYRTGLPYKDYKHQTKQALVSRFGHGSWCLISDVDERFDYPYSESIGLTEFLQYLNENHFSGVVAYLLDLFPDGPIVTWPAVGKELERCSNWFDLSGLETQEFTANRKNEISNLEIPRYFAGIRNLAFGLEDGRPALTKIPLLFPSKGAAPDANWDHDCQGAALADVSCILKHYKFHSQFLDQAKLAVKDGNYSVDSLEYKYYLSAIAENPNFQIWRATSKRYSGMQSLIDENFVYVTDRYNDYVASRNRSAP